MTDKNPIQAIDKLARNRIFNSRYWKEQCFALNAQTIIDKAIKLKTIGGLYGGAKKPTKFLCLLLKMLQMHIQKQIVLEYLKARQYKYLTALALFYLRLTVKGAQVYQLIQPFYNDNRKLVIKDSIGRHEITHMDQLADRLLTQEVVMGISLPFLAKRMVFEQQGLLQQRASILEQQDLQNQLNQQQQNSAKCKQQQKQIQKNNIIQEQSNQHEQYQNYSNQQN